jgi:ubiquinone/menaquinone biosynthesis C-methylase UbiE
MSEPNQGETTASNTSHTLTRESRYGPFERFVAFNAYERDRWIERQARRVAPGSRVIDVGAGQCRYRPLFAHCEYKSQDFSQLDPSQSGWPGYGSIDYVSDITAIPVDDASFDVALCTEVLEHVPDPIAAIREIARILRRGGRLILTAPQRSGAHQRPYHFYGGFTPSWYRRILPAAGLDVESIESNGGFFKAYGEESQRFTTLLLPTQLRQSRPWLWPAWAVLRARAALIAMACHWLDRYDTDRGFTVGWHVVATKR